MKLDVDKLQKEMMELEKIAKSLVHMKLDQKINLYFFVYVFLKF